MDPGARRAICRLKSANFVVALQGQRDFVETLQQPFAASRIDFEVVPLSRWREDRLCLEIDADFPGALCRFDISRQGVDDVLLDHNRKNSILKAVGEKNIAEAG